MNAQVFTIRHSASSARSASGKPASVSMPSISSESTWFLGHPSVVRWTFMRTSQYINRSGDDLHAQPARVVLDQPVRQLQRLAQRDSLGRDQTRRRVDD